MAEIARHSKIYPASSDDYAPPPQDWSPLQHESIWHVLVRDVDELLGMFVFIPESTNLLENPRLPASLCLWTKC